MAFVPGEIQQRPAVVFLLAVPACQHFQSAQKVFRYLELMSRYCTFEERGHLVL